MRFALKRLHRWNVTFTGTIVAVPGTPGVVLTEPAEIWQDQSTVRADQPRARSSLLIGGLPRGLSSVVGPRPELLKVTTEGALPKRDRSPRPPFSKFLASRRH